MWGFWLLMTVIRLVDGRFSNVGLVWSVVVVRSLLWRFRLYCSWYYRIMVRSRKDLELLVLQMLTTF